MRRRMIGAILAFALFFSACGIREKLIQKERNDFVDLTAWEIASDDSFGNKEIHFNNGGVSNATFDCSVDRGWLKADSFIGRTVSTLGNEMIYWMPYNPAMDYWTPEMVVTVDYIEIVIKESKHIVGYAIIKVVAEGNIETSRPIAGNYSASVLKSVLFPKIGEKYQEITQQQIQKIKMKAVES